MFTFSFGSAFATVSWTGEATSKTLNEAGDYDLNSKLVLDNSKTGDGAKGITEAYRAQLNADAKAELKHAKEAGTFYAPEKAAAVAAIEAYIEALKTVKTAKDADKLTKDLADKVGTWTNGKLTEKVENGVLVSLPTQATVRKLMAAATTDKTITVDGKSVNVKADGIAKANSGNATFDLTRIAKRNADTTDASKVANSLYLPGCVELKTDQVKATVVSGSTPADYTFALQLDKSADTKASDIFVDTPTATGAKEIRDWFLDNGYREAADFDAGSRAFVAALVGVNSAYKNVAEGEAVAIQKEIDKYVDGGVAMMGFIAFVMLVAAGYAQVLRETHSVESLVNATTAVINTKLSGAIVMLLVGLLITMGIGTSFGTIPVVASIYIPMGYKLGFSTGSIILLIGIAAALGDAGSPASDSTLGPTSGLNADGQHNHIWDTCVPTFIFYDITLLIGGVIGAMILG